MNSTLRSRRLAASIQKEVSSMIGERQLKEFKDGKLTGIITVTEVKLSGGYQHAHVFMSVLEAEHKDSALEVCTAAVPSMRGEICRRLRLRYAPELKFHLDDSLRRSNEVWATLDQLRGDTIVST